MNKEKWINIKNYNGLYQISNFGNVKSLINKGKLLKPRNDGVGYLFVSLYKDKKAKHFKLHKLVAQAFIPNPDNKPQVNHIDGNKQNNRVDNLEWCTCSENMIHAVNTGLYKTGEIHHSSKLKNNDIKYIRELYKDKKHTQKQIAKTYNVNQSTIGRIINNQIWKTIK